MEFKNTCLELKPEDFKLDNTQRKHFKLMMNAGLGKLAQKKKNLKTHFVTCEEDIRKLWKADEEIIDMFALSDTLCQVNTVSSKSSNAKKSNFGYPEFVSSANPVLYSFITARTRIILHKSIMQLAKENFRIYYCDCDSIIFAGKKNLPIPLNIGSACGQFRPELSEHGKITSFTGHGRKNFRITYEEENSLEKNYLYKLSGISLKSVRAQESVSHLYADFIKNTGKSGEAKHITIPQVRRHKKKPLDTVYTAQNFSVRCDVFCQRTVNYNAKFIPTYPWGFSKCE